MRTKSPLFIIGNPRSGTSLLRLILTSHSQIIIPPECGFIIWLHQEYKDWNISDNHNKQKVDYFIENLFKCKKFETWNLSRKEIIQQIHKQVPTNYSALCRVIYLSFSEKHNSSANIWGDKNNFHIGYLNKLLHLYKYAKFLHIVRDGRDIACSYREVMNSQYNSLYAPKLKTDISEVAEEWRKNTSKTESFISKLPNKSAMTIRYEDLVTSPSTTLHSICSWLDLTFEAEILNYYVNNKDNTLEPSATIEWKKRTLHPISTKTLKRYTKELSNDEQKKFLVIAKESLTYFSYDI